MSKCKHLYAWALTRSVVIDGVGRAMHFRRCDCGHWLSLGPANDGHGSDFTIKIEIRAAALAVMPAGAYARNDEWAGWAAHDDGDCLPRDADGDEAQCWHAGYLARVIDQHDSHSASTAGGGE